jgi:hypothetical protein
MKKAMGLNASRLEREEAEAESEPLGLLTADAVQGRASE